MNIKAIKEFCCEDPSLIEGHKEAIESGERYDCHHRLETHTSDGERRTVDLTKMELIKLDMYFNRPANELIFLPYKEHTSLHQKGRVKSNNERANISKGQMGKKLSQETRNKLSVAHIGKTPWNKGISISEEVKSSISETLKGNIPWNKGFKGCQIGHSKGKHWFNNGVINILEFDCPEGFVSGMMRK